MERLKIRTCKHGEEHAEESNKQQHPYQTNGLDVMELINKMQLLTSSICIIFYFGSQTVYLWMTLVYMVKEGRSKSSQVYYKMVVDQWYLEALLHLVLFRCYYKFWLILFTLDRRLELDNHRWIRVRVTKPTSVYGWRHTSLKGDV